MAFGAYLLNHTWSGLLRVRPGSARWRRIGSLHVAASDKRGISAAPSPIWAGRHGLEHSVVGPGMDAGAGHPLGVVVWPNGAPGLRKAFGFGYSALSSWRQLTALAFVPRQFWVALPYLITVLAVVFAPGSRYPAALGIPYRAAGQAV